ncbi:uncharacterized protein PgNI_01084 [Pyricularia grisea]|uniref:Uncharacterized protein n=1 Tax=Pyricularia grisea TaxID=148305 RepID=A0A6P8BG99_PYRGI|nr:uncharacterized protein PgNI_01084 [Pyricularia grisea]TLD15730.1 hypothetical protein PgNI_01084 [Pyricularia grisea]
MVLEITRFAGFEVGFELLLAAFVEIISIVVIVIDRKPLEVFEELSQLVVRCCSALLKAVLDNGPFSLLLATRQSETLGSAELTRCEA